MAEFTPDHHFQSLIKPSFPFLDHVFDDEITQFSGVSQSSSSNNCINGGAALQNPTLMSFQTFLPFSNDNFFSSSNPSNEATPPSSAQDPTTRSASVRAVSESFDHHVHSNDNKKRKSPIFDASESSSVSESGIKKKIVGSGKGKRAKNGNNGKEEEKLKEVVHVRARRGQATDSHSLAERVRRGKINERLRCLQDIVPGCYKTMGMAVMLDEIINYVQSLQNQVEFLSMKLTAASTFYDFNSETDAVEKLQRAKANEAKEMERLVRDGYGGFACFHSNWPL